MKKLLIFLIMIIMYVMPVLAGSVCTKNSVVSVVLDPSINGESAISGSSSWKVFFSYGNISGVSACLSTRGSPGTIISSITAVGGENQGNYCYCKMMHPMSSLWFIDDSRSDCVSRCAGLCKNRVQNEAAVRRALFNSVAAANNAF